ncbi:MAG: thiocillin family RiPP [Anaerolineales bacterium]|nr:thiocillin family RiPP [Anaerolineales bacterium]MCA9976479.1 thiocillin family RiPP [Anaerolineales bacterium]
MANNAFEDDVVDFEDVDLFAEDIEERLNAGTTSCIASGTSVSTASSCWCSFSTIGCACTSSSIVEA